MASQQKTELLQLAPFKGLDATSGGLFSEVDRASALSNVDPSRVLGAFTTARGRVNLATFAANISSVALVEPTESTRYAVASLANNTVAAYALDTPATTTVTSGVSFTQAVQYGSVLYTNTGQQIDASGGNPPLKAAKWQYQISDTGFSLFSLTSGGGSLSYKLYYAYTVVVQPPGNGPKQESTQYGATPTPGTPYPWVVAGSANPSVGVTATNNIWSGTLADGSTWYVNLYRKSDVQPTWFLVATAGTPPSASVGQLTNGQVYSDTITDAQAQQNPQITFYQDPPPLSSSAPGVIFSHKDRLWAFTVVSNADTNNQPQCQLWFSSYGIPWQFNKVTGVRLVGNSNTPAVSTPATFGDLPVSGVSLSSVAVLFKKRTLWIVYGDDENTYIVRKVGDNGCVSAASVAVCQGVVCWLTEEGVFSFDGASPPQYFSEMIASALESIPRSDWANAVGWFADRSYYLSFPATGVTYRFYFPTKEWYQYNYGTAAALSVPAQSAPAPVAQRFNMVLAARGTNLDAWNAAETDLGANVVGSWTGPLTDSGLRGVEKSYDVVELTAPVQNLIATVILTIDPGAATPPTKQFSWNVDLSKGPTAIWEVPNDATAGKSNSGFLAQLSVSVPSTGAAPATIYSLSVHGEPKRKLVPIDNGAVR